MPDPVRLPLYTSDGRPLMHKYYPQDGQSAGLLVVFPGAHYGPEGPLLYYPRELLKHAGWDTLDVSYGFQTRMAEITAEIFESVLAESSAAIKIAMAQRGYDRVGLLGKSLGAGVIAHLCRGEPRLAYARAAYLTPPLGAPFFDPIVSETQQPSFLAIGTSDRFYNVKALEALKSERPFQTTTIDGADHHMSFPGDLESSLMATQEVVQEVVGFFLEG
jgi:dienelactone hydrolase